MQWGWKSIWQEWLPGWSAPIASPVIQGCGDKIKLFFSALTADRNLPYCRSCWISVRGRRGREEKSKAIPHLVHTFLISGGHEIGWGLSCILCTQCLALRGANKCKKDTAQKGARRTWAELYFMLYPLFKRHGESIAVWYGYNCSEISLQLLKMEKNLSWQDLLCSVPGKCRAHSHSSRDGRWGGRRGFFLWGKTWFFLKNQ